MQSLRLLRMNRHYEAESELETLVAALPKTETHLHLEGSVSFEQLHRFDPEKYPDPPPFWHPEFRYESFDHFQSTFNDWIVPYHSSIDRYRETARYVFAQCVSQGCRYVETSFHLPTIQVLDGDGPDLIAAVSEVVPDGLEVRLFGGMMHNDYSRNKELLEAALGWDDLAGFDLHGPETWPVEDAIPDFWRRAREQGKFTKAHAGEFMPASFVDWVIENLGVCRIEHGVRAVESPELIDKLVDQGIVLDVCPISNLKLGVDGVDHLSSHPVRILVDAGVCVTVSTDDTFMFGNTLAEEYFALSQELGFTSEELIQIARNGFNSALIESAQRDEFLSELRVIENGLGE